MDFINSEFAKLLIILIAIFAVFFAGIKNKPQTQGNKNVHIWYICGIASFIVIGLITYIVVGNYHAENIMDYVSFASTLSSLILSILAIFITVLSNDSLGKVKDALIDLPQSVKQTVNDSVKEMRTVALEVEKIADNNANSQQGTIAKLQELLSNLESHMDKSFNETRETMLDFNNKLSDLTMTNSLKGNSSSLITQDIADKFLSGTSYLSLQLLCAWDEYKKSNISAPVSINRLLQCFGFEEQNGLNMYIFACIVLLNAFGFIDYKQVNKRDFDNIIIGEMNPTLKSQFRLHFDQTDNATKTRENIIKYFKELGNSTSDSDQRQ